ncbi:hypothetical protein [Aquipseudomonas alcaligenes]|uniref:hypothetical protein n=1 Tax=Aquipseudomonas alcaligenes TaxID=43263 RepID=UPI00374A1836
MSEAELYEALRVLVREYIVEPEQEKLLELLDSKETQGIPAPGKGILQSLGELKNGRPLTLEHKNLSFQICNHCV